MTDLERIESSIELQTKRIPLTRDVSAIVDIEDYERLSKYKWHATICDKRTIATRWTKDATILMHREILGFPDSESIDHANGNSLDNRKSNLRPCSHAQNTWNKGFKVSYINVL